MVSTQVEYTLNLLGALLLVAGQVPTALMIAWLASQPGIAYRKYVTFGAVIYGVHAGTAVAVGYGLYFHRFSLQLGLIRVTLGVLCLIEMGIVALFLREWLGSLRVAYNTKALLEDERKDRLWSAQNIVDIGTKANKRQDSHLALLEEQRGRLIRHGAAS